MGRTLRFVVCTGDEKFGADLRAQLQGFKGVKIVAETDEPVLLAQTLSDVPTDILLIDLDPIPDSVLPIVADLVARNPALAVFAVSTSTDGKLILEAMRKGVKEYLPRPIDTKALDEAIQRAGAKVVEQTQQGKLITIMGSAGGVGASFLAANLSVELASLAGGAVTIVDMDYRFGHVATLLDVDATYTLADLCHSPEALEPQILERALVRHDSGVQVLSRPASLSQADVMTASSCVGLLSNLLQVNEYVLADGPNRFDLSAKSVLDLSDINLLVVQLFVPAVRNAVRIIEGMREHGFNLERTWLICNRVGKDSGHLSIEDVEQTLGLKTAATLPDDWATVSASINLGEPLMTQSPKSKIRLAIEDIALRLHNASDAADEAPADQKKGVLSRIFSS